MLQKIKVRYNTLPTPAKASMWFLICSFFQKGISVLTTPIFTRLLTTNEFGQYNVFSSWLSIITIFVTLNLSAGVYSQGLVKFEEESKVFSSSLQGLNFILCMIWTGIYLLFNRQINKLIGLTSVQVLAMLVMIWATTVFQFWSAEQRVNYRYKCLVIVSIVASILKPVIGIVFVLLAEDKVTARILGLALVELVLYIPLFANQVKRGKKVVSKKFWKYALLYNLPLIPHYLSQTVLNNSDRIMIENMVSEEAAGIYSLAYSISQIMTLFNIALSQTISPWIYRKIKDKKIDEISRVAYLSIGIIAIANVMLIAFAPEAVALFAPNEYYEAIWVIPPVAMSVIFSYSYDLFAKFEFYYEKTNFIMFASIIGAALNIILNVIFVEFYGYIAAAYTTLICYMLYAIGHYIFMNKICNKFLNGIKPYSLKSLLFIYGVFLIVGFALLLTYNIPILRYTVIFIMFCTMIVSRKKIIDMVKLMVSLKKG